MSVIDSNVWCIIPFSYSCIKQIQPHCYILSYNHKPHDYIQPLFLLFCFEIVELNDFAKVFSNFVARLLLQLVYILIFFIYILKSYDKALCSLFDSENQETWNEERGIFEHRVCRYQCFTYLPIILKGVGKCVHVLTLIMVKFDFICGENNFLRILSQSFTNSFWVRLV